MPRIAVRALTAKFCQGAGPGRYSDRGAPGLMLIVGKTGARSWVQRITVAGKRRDFGLGSFRTTPLAIARERATENAARVEAERFVDVGSRRPCGPVIPSTIPTLADCLEAVVAGKVAAGSWKPGSTSAQEWRRSLTNHAEALGAMRVDTVESADILVVLSPLMAGGSAAIVDRIRPRIKAALDHAIAMGYRADNPAGEQLLAALPKPKTAKAGHEAVPHARVAEAVATVRASGQCEAMRALIVFAVLTAARSGEARGATWSEIDFDAATWTVPGKRMKAGAEHRVPLSGAAVALLRSIRPADVDGSALVFAAPSGGEFQGVRSLSRAVRELKLGGTLHGFRSSFRDWAAETGQGRDVAEAALAHSTAKNMTEAAYLRTDMLAARVPLMEAWGKHVAP